MKTFKKILYVGIFIMLLCILGYELIWEKNYTVNFLCKAITVTLSYLVFLVRVFTAGESAPTNIGNKKKYYKDKYPQFIGAVFEDDKKSEKLLYGAIHLYESGQHGKALNKLEKLQDRYQTRSEQYTINAFSGLCCHDLKNFQAAIRHYQTALQIKENTTLLSNTGLCYKSLGNYSSAIECYKRAVELDETNAHAINNLAQMCIRAEQYEWGIDYATRAVELNPNLSPAWNALTVCHYMLGDTAEYERCYRRAVSCGSDSKKLKNYLRSMDPTL